MNASACLTLYNEGLGVKRMLDYIETHAKMIDDLIIVSDDCHDSTDSIVETWANQHHPFKVSFFQRSKRLGRASAIRLCLKNSLNDINIILAGDIEPIGNAFEDLLGYFKDPNVGAVTGHPLLLNGEKSIADCLSHIIWDSHDEIRRIKNQEGTLFHLSGEVFAIRKSALKGFDNYLGLVDDAMIGYLIHESGYRVVFADNVRYKMQYPSTLKGYLNVRKRCCYGRIELARIAKITDYPYYEISHSQYLINILKTVKGKPLRLLSLAPGISIESLCRIYYQFKHLKNNDLYAKLWQPAIDTKW